MKENNGVIPPMVTIRVIPNHLGERLEVGVPFKADTAYQMRVLYEQRFIGLAPVPEKPVTRPADSELASRTLAEPVSSPAPKRRR